MTSAQGPEDSPPQSLLRGRAGKGLRAASGALRVDTQPWPAASRTGPPAPAAVRRPGALGPGGEDAPSAWECGRSPVLPHRSVPTLAPPGSRPPAGSVRGGGGEGLLLSAPHPQDVPGRLSLHLTSGKARAPALLPSGSPLLGSGVSSCCKNQHGLDADIVVPVVQDHCHRRRGPQPRPLTRPWAMRGAHVGGPLTWPSPLDTVGGRAVRTSSWVRPEPRAGRRGGRPGQRASALMWFTVGTRAEDAAGCPCVGPGVRGGVVCVCVRVRAVSLCAGGGACGL